MADIRIVMELDDGDLPAALNRSATAVETFERKASASSSRVKEMEASTRSLGKTLRDVTVTLGLAHRAFEMIESVSTSWVHKIVDVNAEFERMVSVMRALSTAKDPLAQATQSVTELRKEAKEAPFSLNAIHTAMTRVTAAGLPAKQTMHSLMDAVAAFGGTDDQLNRASLAFQEMAGKGVVQMKELRNQLMMAVPNAGNLIARSFGESYEQVMSDIHTGTVDAKATIAGFTLEAERAFGGAAQRQMQTFNGLIGQTAVLLQSIAVEDVGKPMDKDTGQYNETGFMGTMKKQVQEFNGFLDSKQAHVVGQDLGNGLTAAVNDLRDMVGYAIKFHDEIKMAGYALAGVFAVRLSVAGAGGVLGYFGSLGTSLKKVSTEYKQAMKMIEEGGEAAAVTRVHILNRQAHAAKQAQNVADDLSFAAHIRAQEAERRAASPPAAVARSAGEQADLDRKATAARKAFNDARIEAQRVTEEIDIDLQRHISAREGQAQRARERADNPTGPRTPAGQDALDVAATNAERRALDARLDGRRAALNQQRDLEREVNASRVRMQEAEAAARAQPTAGVRTQAEQAQLDTAAIKARQEAETLEAAAAVRANETRAVSGAAASEEQTLASTGRLTRAYGGMKALMPTIAAGFGAIVTWAPIAGIAIAALSDYFDIFNLKSSEAWENLKHYGAASREAAEAGKPYLDNLKATIGSLDELIARAKQREANPIASEGDEGTFLKSSLELIQEKEAALKQLGVDTKTYNALVQEGMEADARKYSRTQMGSLDRQMMGVQLKYNQDQLEAQKRHSDQTNMLNAQGRSAAGETMSYQQSQHAAQLAYYDKELKIIRELTDANEKRVESDDPATKLEGQQALLDLMEKQKTVEEQRAETDKQRMGLELHKKGIDDAKLMGNANAELEKLYASQDGYKAGIEGADEQAEKLYETWKNLAKAGDYNVAKVREMYEALRQAKETADDYQKIMNGGDKLSKSYQDIIDKDNERIFKAQYGKLSEVEQLRKRREMGEFAGFGGDTQEAQRLTRLREMNDQVYKTGGLFADETGRAADNIERLTRALGGSNNALVGLMNGGGQGVFSPQSGGAGMSGNNSDWNNNPGNMSNSDISRRYGGQDGKRFSVFPTPQLGYLAADANLDSYARQGVTTPREIIMKWAPPSENNTKAYIGNISKGAGVDPDQPLPADHRAAFLHTMTGIEKGRAPYSTEQIAEWIKKGGSNPNSVMFGGGPARLNTPLNDKIGSQDKEAAATEARAKRAEADAEMRAMRDKLHNKDIATEMEAAGAGKNYATMVAAIKQHGKDTTIGSDDPANPKWKSYIDDANKKDKDDAGLKKLTEETTAAQSAMKVNQEKLTSTAADTANAIAHLGHTAGATTDAIQKEIDSAKTRRDSIVTRYGIGSKEGQQAQSDFTSQVDGFKSMGAAKDAEEAEKKTIKLRESVMSQEEADADRVAKLRQQYDDDLAAFKGTEEEKAKIARTFNENIAAEQAALAAKTPFAKEMKGWGDITKNVQQDLAGFANTAVDGLTSYIMTGKNQWHQIAVSMTKSLLETGLKGGMSAAMNLSGLSGLLGGGGLGKGGAPMQLAGAASGGGAGKLAGIGAMFGVHHAGGIIGAGEGPMRFLNMAGLAHHFGGAPRYHTGGLAGDEVPIIAQRGEGVFTKGQMAAMGAGMKGGSAGAHTFNVNNNVSVNAQGGDPSQNADLAKQIGQHVDRVARTTVVDEIMRQMRPGNLLSTDATNVFGRN